MKYSSKSVRENLGLVTAGEVSVIYGIDESGLKARIRKGTFPKPDIEYYDQTPRGRYCRRFWYKNNLPNEYEVKRRSYKKGTEDFKQPILRYDSRVKKILNDTSAFFNILNQHGKQTLSDC